MPQELLLQVTPDIAANELLLKEYLSKQIKVAVSEIQHVSILKRSTDARQKSVKINLKVLIFLKGEAFQETKFQLPDYKNVSNAQEVIVVGAGPAGLFAVFQRRYRQPAGPDRAGSGAWQFFLHPLGR